MGIFSKVWKGIKKTVKKVARGIKKVVSQIFGKALSTIHTAGSMVGKVYTGITNTIDAAFDVATGKGTFKDLKDAAGSIFSGPTNEAKSLLTGDKLATYKKEQALLDIPKKPVVNIEEVALPKIDKTIEKGVPKIEIKSVPTTPEQKSLTERALDYGQKQIDNVKEAITDFDLGEQVVGGAASGVKQRVASEIVNNPDPVYNSTTLNIPSYMGMAHNNDSIFNQVDLTIQRDVGNPYALTAIKNYDYIQSGLLQDETSWFHNRQHAINVAGGG
jgi:hypothetical protein